MSIRGESRSPGRPHAASRAEVERVALGLMLREGYDAVSVEAVAQAAGIGRTTLFRYFGSKAGVIWSAFDSNIATLRSSIAAASPQQDPLDVVRLGIIESTEASTSDSDVWLERFELIDSVETLRQGAYQHWESWKAVIAEYIADRTGEPAGNAIPMAIAGASQAVFVAELRTLLLSRADREQLLNQLDADLTVVCASLRPLLDRASAAP